MSKSHSKKRPKADSLHLAAENGKLNIIQNLVQKGAKIDLLDNVSISILFLFILLYYVIILFYY